MLETIIQPAPRYIPALTDPADFWIQVILTIVTLAAVIVALFQEKIKDFFNRAKLNVEIKTDPPDTHQILLSDRNGMPITQCIYVRIRVSNTSLNTARGIELLISNFQKFEDDGKRTKLRNFLPMNLRTAHDHQNTTLIPPNSFRHFDLGYLKPMAHAPTLTDFRIDTIIQPNPISGNIPANVFNPGKYELEILITGDNIIPQTKRWLFAFEETWSDRELEMLERLTVKEHSK